MRGSTPTAALAGVPAGVQALGPWMGRRQMFVRFAGEAETATMYTADALAGELARSALRSAFHSISVSGRDPLANSEYLIAVFEASAPPLPVMLDCDGQRPEAIPAIARHVALVQVTLDASGADPVMERAAATLGHAAAAGVDHALVLTPSEHVVDGQLLRLVEQAHAASEKTAVVIHPPAGSAEKDRRWLTLMERAMAIHRDTRVFVRLPAPTGMR